MCRRPFGFRPVTAIVGLITSVWIVGCAREPAPPPPAHVVFVGGTVFARESATAVAVRDGAVIAVGSDRAIERYAGADTCVVDLDGRMLLPGFEDDHLHLAAGVTSLTGPKLGDVRSVSELEALLRVHEASLAPGAWLRGVGLRPHVARHLGPDDLERLFPDRPVALLSADGMTSLTNRRGRSTPEPASRLGPGALERGVRYVSRFGITAARSSGLFHPDEDAPLLSLAERGRLPFHLSHRPIESHAGLQTDRARHLAHLHPFKIAGDWIPLRQIGRPRLPLRSIKRQGFDIHFGSDWPLAPLDPLAGIAAAAGRRDLDQKPERGFLPEEKLTVTEAVYAYTHRFLEPGMPAEMAVISHDLWKLPEEQLATAKVEMTLFSGRVTYLARSFAPEVECLRRLARWALWK